MSMRAFLFARPAASGGASAARVAHRVADDGRCAACRHRATDRATLEHSVAGLTVFSSGYGASVADSRLCGVHDRLVSPDDTCSRFEPAG